MYAFGISQLIILFLLLQKSAYILSSCLVFTKKKFKMRHSQKSKQNLSSCRRRVCFLFHGNHYFRFNISSCSFCASVYFQFLSIHHPSTQTSWQTVFKHSNHNHRQWYRKKHFSQLTNKRGKWSQVELCVHFRIITGIHHTPA